jgi:hypothetical protein
MANKLFIVCPFSCLETFIKKNYGDDAIFLTYAGTVLEPHDFVFNLGIKHLILKEKIKKIYLVNDTSCRFINSIIKRKQLIGLTCEKIIEELYIENYFSYFQSQPVLAQQHNLAELNIKSQINRILKFKLFNDFIAESGIEIKGIITSKERNAIKELQIDNPIKA